MGSFRPTSLQLSPRPRINLAEPSTPSTITGQWHFLASGVDPGAVVQHQLSKAFVHRLVSLEPKGIIEVAFKSDAGNRTFVLTPSATDIGPQQPPPSLPSHRTSHRDDADAVAADSSQRRAKQPLESFAAQGSGDDDEELGAIVQSDDEEEGGDVDRQPWTEKHLEDMVTSDVEEDVASSIEDGNIGVREARSNSGGDRTPASAALGGSTMSPDRKMQDVRVANEPTRPTLAHDVQEHGILQKGLRHHEHSDHDCGEPQSGSCQFDDTLHAVSLAHGTGAHPSPNPAAAASTLPATIVAAKLAQPSLAESQPSRRNVSRETKRSSRSASFDLTQSPPRHSAQTLKHRPASDELRQSFQSQPSSGTHVI